MSSRAELVGAALGALRRLGTEIDGLDQRAAARFGIGRTDLHLIDRLRSQDAQTPTELARALGLTSGGLSIALERLERIGYIRRSQHPDDRRRVLVEATPAIIPIEDEVFGPLIERMQSLIGTYSDRELTTIRDFLDQASAVIGQSGPGVAPAPGPPDPRSSRSNSRRPRRAAPP